MTPEEKLLALIQQDKRQAEGAAAKPVAPVSPEASPVLAPQPVAVAPTPAPSVPPVERIAPPPASDSKKTSVPVAIPGDKKLKLADPVMPKPVDPVVEKTGSPAPVPVVTAPLPVAVSKEPALPASSTPAPAVIPQAQEALQEEPVSSVVLDGRGISSGSRLVLINRALGGLVLALVVLVFYRVGAIQPEISKSIDKQISGAGSMSVAPLVITEQAAPQLETYLDKVGARNIFQAKVTTKEGVPVTVEATGAPKDLKLVAISMDSASEDESVAIIKNKADSKTYFVKLGQTVGSTEYVLSKIHADRVVLKQRKQEYELK